MKLQAAIETGTTGLWYGRVTTLIGTHARAPSRDLLLQELSEELRYHIGWLRRNGEKTTAFDDPTVEVAEEVSGVQLLGESGGEVAFFRSDEEPVPDELLRRCIRCMGYNREEILRAVEGLSEDRLNNVPPGKGRSINQILQHVCNAEEWYMSRLGAEADTLYEEKLGRPVSEVDSLPIQDRMEAVRRGCVASLRVLVPAKNGSILTRAEYTSYPSEKWSTRKVIRRYLEHEREHIYNIREYLGLQPRQPDL
ncbi:DinB family protein [Candidatus Bathyarchaeota archaeon]|nr:DinB family protein [Candidatus Bathyarchaeota archaeon]